jgi:hypothetical protein
MGLQAMHYFGHIGTGKAGGGLVSSLFALFFFFGCHNLLPVVDF